MRLIKRSLGKGVILLGLASILSNCQQTKINIGGLDSILWEQEEQDTGKGEDTSEEKNSSYFILTDEQRLWTGNYADPSVIQYEERFLMYLNTFVEGAGYLVFSSNDGLSWTQERDIIFPGIATARAYVFEEGVRFYYPITIEGVDTGEYSPGTEPKEIVSAFSYDGLSFEEEDGVRISPAEGYSAWGPTVVQLSDSAYRMFFTEGTSSVTHLGQGVIYSASSDDGFNWNRDENIILEAEEAVEGQQKDEFQAMHPFVTPWHDNFLMFYTSHLETFAAYSNDSYTWTKLGSVGIPNDSADIDGYIIDNETMRIYFGRYSEETGGEVYTGLLKIALPE